MAVVSTGLGSVEEGLALSSFQPLMTGTSETTVRGAAPRCGRRGDLGGSARWMLMRPWRPRIEGDVVEVFRFLGDADGLVDGVGEQALFGRMDGVEEAFAAEVAVFDDGEGAAVEGEAGGVGDPERAQRWSGLLRRPERHAFGVDLVCRMGTRADSFLRMVMGWVRL